VDLVRGLNGLLLLLPYKLDQQIEAEDGVMQFHWLLLLLDH